VLLATLATGCFLRRDGEEANYDDPLGTKLKRLAYFGSITGHNDNLLSKPLAVAVASGVVYVVDRKTPPPDLPLPALVTGRVQAFREKDGKFLYAFNRAGPRRALDQPSSIAIHPKTRNLFVSDYGHKAVLQFKPKGQFVGEIKPPGGAVKSWAPAAIAFDSEGNLYVLDSSPKRARVVALQGTTRLRKTIGRIGAAKEPEEKPGQFWYPAGLAIARDGSIFVSDSLNKRIQVFDESGAFRKILYTGGQPRGIVSAPDGLLVVPDAYMHQLLLYSPDGKEIADFGEEGYNGGRFTSPNGVALDAQKAWVFVADPGTNRVEVWAPAGTKR